jgi:mono/diheme cytochrome c family protein
VRSIYRFAPGLFACLALLACPALADTSLEWGARLFLDGQAASGVSARVGPDDGVEVPLQTVACARCHGTDAAGRSEGGVAAPAIDWFRLTKPWGHNFEDGRRRQAYVAESFHRALALGLDPSGNRLDTRMPRFSLSSNSSGI